MVYLKEDKSFKINELRLINKKKSKNILKKLLLKYLNSLSLKQYIKKKHEHNTTIKSGKNGPVIKANGRR